MRSFSILSLVATAAFSLFAAAAPAPGHTHVDVGAAAAAHAHVQRDVALKSVPVILTQLTIDLTPSCEELKYIRKDNCTSEVLTPIFNEIVVHVGVAIADIKLLVGADLSVILCGVDGKVQVAVSVVAELLCTVLHLVIDVLAKLVVIVNYNLSLLGPVLATIGACLCELIAAVLGVVAGLLLELVPLVLYLLPSIKVLAFTSIGAVLKVSL